MLKSAGNHLTCFLTECFNEISKNGDCPDPWAQSVVVPINRKGNVDVPDNYRGVSLLNTLGRCYTAIHKKRLYNWLQDNNKIEEIQAGFRRGYSTTDRVFTLYAITEKYPPERGGKLYVAFRDLRMTFDCVKRETLLKTLCRAGVCPLSL